MTTTHPTLGEARLPSNPLLSEVLSLVSKQKTKAKKIQILRGEKLSLMEDIYTIVDKAIDVAFEEQKFHLKFYDFMQSCKTTGVGAKEFNQSSTAKELTDLVDDLSKYIKGGKDSEHQILREAYGHLGKPKARKIKDYFNVILEDAQRYEKERRRGRRKTKTK